nr:hypothetical protein [Tanacetum cinerariifolium]
MHKVFSLLVRKFPLPEGTSHYPKKNATARRKVLPLPEVCTAIIVEEKPRISLNTHLTFTISSKQDMDQQYPTVAKIPMLDTDKFEQWQFRMQQYLQHEHYALWEVIEFEDSYKAPENNPSTTTTSTTSGDKSGRTVTLTTEDIQKKKNDVKSRTTLLLSLLDEHQLRFSQLQFMGAEVEQDDLNQKFLTSLAPEWLMHTIVWRNRSDLDTMSLDDLYNHLKTSSGRRHGRRLTFKDQMLQGLINQKLNALTVTRWAILQENAELPETRRDEGETPTDKSIKLKNILQKH